MPWRVADSLHRSHVRQHARFEAVRADYSVMNRSGFEPEALALCREHRLGFLASSPLAGGFLAAPPATCGTDRAGTDERVGRIAGDAVPRVLAELADRRLATPAQIALAWVLGNPLVTSTAIDAASPRELRELIRAADTILAPEEMGALAHVTTMRASPMELHHV